MVDFLINFLLVARSRLRSGARLEAENIILRQQVIVLSGKSRSRVWLRNIDRLVFAWLYRLFPSVLNAITVGMGRSCRVLIARGRSSRAAAHRRPNPKAVDNFNAV